MTEEHRCELQGEKKFATAEAPFHFTASGLPNVFLVGIDYWACPCGNLSAEIPAVKQLMTVIARSLVNKDSVLDGDEIRFLRKRLGKKAADFAQQLRITPEHLSKLENGHLPVGEQTDALVRFVYIFQSKDEVLQHSFRQANAMARNLRPTSSERILAQVVESDWDVLPTAA